MQKKLIPMFNSWIIYTAISIFSLFYAINPIYSLREIWLEIGYSIITILIAAAWVKDEHAFSRTVHAFKAPYNCKNGLPSSSLKVLTTDFKAPYNCKTGSRACIIEVSADGIFKAAKTLLSHT